MRYVVDLDGDRIWPHGVGVALDRAAAQQVARTIAEHFGVAEGIPLQDPPEPAYRPFTSNPPGIEAPVDPTAWEDEPPPHDDLSGRARMA